MRLRVGLILPDGAGGIARYGQELAGALMRIDEVDVVTIARQAARERFEAIAARRTSPDHIAVPEGGALTEALFVRHRLGPIARRAGLDVIHGMKHLLPARAGLATALTVHDLMVLHRRHEFPAAKRTLLPFWFKCSMHRADALIAVSRTVGAKIVAEFPELGKRVHAVPHAVPEGIFGGAVEAVSGLQSRKFALVVGDLSPRKNIRFLAEIWPQVHKKTGLALAVAGPEGWNNSEAVSALERISALGLGVRLGHVSDAQLRWLYDNAALVCVPSLEEGYGLPVVEALARGCPVVANDDPALVEAGQGLPIHVSTHNPEAWLQAICSITGSTTTTSARPLSRDWDMVAWETAACYRAAVEWEYSTTSTTFGRRRAWL